jgi:two-component system sensor kinase FixL
MELAIGEARVGDLRFFTGFVRDLTERRDQERRFQELQSELVHVSRLTAMGEMASSIAHELNQPLGAVANFLRGASRMLDGEAPDVARARVGLDRAGAEALRAGEIIKRLREFVAKGDTEQALEDPARLLEEACALALVGARERGVRVGLSFDRSLGAVLVDKVQIQQVVFNLVRNAIEAVEAVADPAVRVTLRRSKGQALITVSDNGPGVSPAVAARLFQPFVTSKTTGMGVGLSICRTIVEAQGGRIWLRLNAPGGAEFNFTLPLAEEVADDA